MRVKGAVSFEPTPLTDAKLAPRVQRQTNISQTNR